MTSLLHDSFEAYLGPLLKKHETGQCIVWEDLEASHTAASKVLESKSNIFVSKRLEDLHKKQVKAYLEAAKKALEEWAVATIPLQPMEDTDTKESFVQRCIATLVKPQISPPNWKGGILVSKVVSSTIKKRAEETFDKYHPVGNDDDDNDNDDEQQDQQQEQEDEDLGDVEPSEGEAPSSETEGDTEEEMDTAGGPQKPAESTASKTIKNKLNTAKTKRLQKIAARKKGNMAKRKVFLNNNNNNKRGKKNPGSNNNNNNNNQKWLIQKKKCC